MTRTPTLSSLRLFLQVANSRSFSETARAAHLSQPALSRTIKLLEEDLGVRLFDRNSRNVHLTAAGAALLPIVERLTGDFDLAFLELSAESMALPAEARRIRLWRRRYATCLSCLAGG